MSAQTENDSSVDDIYLKAAQVRHRYGECSDMWVRRRIRDAGFPEPTFLGGLRFWKLRDLERWDRERVIAPKPRPARDMKPAREGKAERSPDADEARWETIDLDPADITPASERRRARKAVAS